MARVDAVLCDLKSCGKMAPAADGAEIPQGWLTAEYYQEGEGSLEMRVFCSWNCVSGWASERIVATPKRRRRTRAEMQAAAADKAAAGVPAA